LQLLPDARQPRRIDSVPSTTSTRSIRRRATHTANRCKCVYIHACVQLLLATVILGMVFSVFYTSTRMIPHHFSTTSMHFASFQAFVAQNNRSTTKRTIHDIKKELQEQQELYQQQLYQRNETQQQEQQQLYQRHETQQQEPRVIMSGTRFPMGNRSLVLSDRWRCAAAIQTTSWQLNLPTDQSRSMWDLQVNPECPSAPEQMAEILQIQQAQQRLTTNAAGGGSESTITSILSSKKITLALLYYQDMALLSRMLDSWLKWPATIRHEFDFLIIDDGSQVGLRAIDLIWPHRERLRMKHVNLTIYELEQDLAWNVGGARNLAHAVAKTPFVLTTDTDVYMNASVASYLLQTLDDSLQEYAKVNTAEQGFNRNQYPLIIWKFFNQLLPDGKDFQPHPAVMLASKDAYWALGGCDEDIVGNYGQTDILFLWKADRDPRIKVRSLSDAMKKENLFLQKIGRPLNKQCMSWALETCQKAPLPFRKKEPRILSHNLELFGRKKRRERPFSNTFLRFGWHRVDFS